MKTIVYIDGYNLYYGCLKNTPFKWLDPVTLLREYILPSSLPEGITVNEIEVKFFTADIIGKAAGSESSLSDQTKYHSALKASYTDQELKIIKGYYTVNDVHAYIIDESNPQQKPKDCRRGKIWKFEEKQTDVNIAVEAMYDSFIDGEITQMVFVTNDTDIAPALKKIKQMGNICIGVVVPTKDRERPVSQYLREHADWTRSRIKAHELQNSQFPRVIRNSVRGRLRKVICKPTEWFGAHEILQQIFRTLETVLRNRTQCWQWLKEEKPTVEGLPLLDKLPINMLDSEEDAAKVLAHAEAYVKYRQSKD